MSLLFLRHLSLQSHLALISLEKWLPFELLHIEWPKVTTVYAHCLSLAVHSGQTVKQGQLIGYVGSTGRSSGNHCHFEIRRNGSYIAPQNVFNRRKYR